MDAIESIDLLLGGSRNVSLASSIARNAYGLCICRDRCRSLEASKEAQGRNETEFPACAIAYCLGVARIGPHFGRRKDSQVDAGRNHTMPLRRKSRVVIATRGGASTRLTSKSDYSMSTIDRAGERVYKATVSASDPLIGSTKSP
jgi:hypothetical protein